MSTSRLRFVVLASAVAVTAAMLSVGKASANIIFPPIDWCAIASANATKTLAPSSGYMSASGDASYAKTLCGRYVVDFYLGPGHAGSFRGGGAYLGPVTPQGQSVLPFSKSACALLKENVTLYSRSLVATSFTRVASGAFKGTWVDDPANPRCEVTQTSGEPAQGLTTVWPGYYTSSSGVLVGTTYRIAVSATLTTIDGPAAIPVLVQGYNWG